MQKTCAHPWCQQPFAITDDDLAFFDRISPTFGGKKELISPPVLCPDCRMQKRLMFRNDLCLYHRTSSLSGKPIIAIYAPDSPYVVYDRDEWWSDVWDPVSYGRSFDFGRTLTEQLQELNLAVPHQSIFNTTCENCDYTNHALQSRNCYLIAGLADSENCLYGRFVIYSHDCIDCLSVYSCEWCYGGIASQHCYQCVYFQNSRNCSDCLCIDECQSCKNCAFCFGLQNREYHFMNEPLRKDEYEEQMQKLSPLTDAALARYLIAFQELKATLPHRADHNYGSEHCTGEMLFESKNCKSCFDCTGCEDCQNLTNSPKSHDSRDGNYTAPDGIEQCYNVSSTVGVPRAMATFLGWYVSDTYYSRELHHCQNCFGCIGLKHKQYCVLNKQYTKEEYEELVPKIIEQMRRTPLRQGFAGQEWGDYLDPTISTMAYNETLAQEYFPLTKEEVLARGWRWRDVVDEIPQVERIINPADLPTSITDIPDDVLNWAIRCSATNRPFRILKSELEFYRRFGIPIPHLHPDERHRRRLTLRNPRKLWKRTCMKCRKEVETTYEPSRPEVVYCEECYLQTVY